MDRAELLESVPHEPRWVEARALLLSSESEVRSAGAGALLVDPSFPIACTVGVPDREVVLDFDRERPTWELLVQAEDLEAVRAMLPDRVVHPATVFAHPDPASLPAPSGAARVLAPGERVAVDHCPESLADELEQSFRRGAPMAVAELDGVAVAFSYGFAKTERLWDVSVDTLEHARRRGLATAAFCALAHALFADGVAPAWGAVDSNPASLAMAARLGFEESAKLYVLVRPAINKG